MKNLFNSMMLVAVAVMGLTSCSKDATEDWVVPQTPKTILTVDAEITRTEFGTGRNMINWSVGDQFGIYSNNNDQNVASSTYKTGEKFTLGVNEFSSALMLYTYYPYAADNGSNVKMNIPAAQSCAAPATLPGADYPLVAKTEVPVGTTNVSFQFQAVGCALALNIFNGVAGETLKSVTFTTTENCCGEQDIDLMTYDFTKAAPTYVGSEKSVTLTAADGVVKLDATTIADAQNYDNQVYLVVAKKEYPAGATFTIETDKGSYKFTTKAILKATNDFKVVKIDLTKAAPDVDPNDYWEAGVTVNGVRYDKNSENAVCLKIGEINYNELKGSKGTVLFIDNKAENGDYITDPCVLEKNVYLTGDMVIIGRYRDHQPIIQTTSGTSHLTFDLRKAGGVYVFKNICFNGTDNNYIFVTNANMAGNIESVTIEDCYIKAGGSVIQDGSADYIMQNVAFRNCIVEYLPKNNAGAILSGKALYTIPKGGNSAKAAGLKSVILDNNVVFSTDEHPASQYLVFLGQGKTTEGSDFNAYPTTNAEVKVENTSIYNIYHTNGLVCVYDAKLISMSNNAAYFDDTDVWVLQNGKLELAPPKISYFMGGYNKDSQGSFSTANNYACNNTDTKYWQGFRTITTGTDSGSNYKMSESPFGSVDLSKGYIPVKNDIQAGATYDTKLWNTWE